MIYLDNASTSYPKPDAVKKAVLSCFDQPHGNLGRSSHTAAVNTSRRIYQARESIAAFFGKTDSLNTIFTSNATEALNMAISNLAGFGSNVLTSAMEHNAVMRPLWHLQAQNKITLRHLNQDENGHIHWDDFKDAVSAKPDLLIFTAASNVTGEVYPFEEMCRIARKNGIRTIVDGSQIAGKRKINLSEFRPDVFCCSGHKGLLGPSGTGLLLLDPELPTFEPLQRGGTGSHSERNDQGESYPDKLESGTPNIPGIIGLGAAVDHILSGSAALQINFPDLLHEMNKMKQLRIVAPKCNDRLPLISFKHHSLGIADLTQHFNNYEIAVRGGLHCAPLAHRTLGTFSDNGTVRISPGIFTTENDIASFFRVLDKL